MYILTNPKWYNVVTDVKALYDERTHYHNWNHILYGLRFARSIQDIEFEWNIEQQLAWLFHDVVYVPGATDNEENSVHLMELMLMDYNNIDTVAIANIIMDTKTHYPTNPLSKSIIDVDWAIFSDAKLLPGCNISICKEFGLHDLALRIEWLKKLDLDKLYFTEYGIRVLRPLAKQNITNEIYRYEHLPHFAI